MGFRAGRWLRPGAREGVRRSAGGTSLLVPKKTGIAVPSDSGSGQTTRFIITRITLDENHSLPSQMHVYYAVLIIARGA